METIPSLIDDCIKNKKRLARENAQVQQNITSINRQGPVFPKQQTTSKLREVQTEWSSWFPEKFLSQFIPLHSFHSLFISFQTKSFNYWTSLKRWVFRARFWSGTRKLWWSKKPIDYLLLSSLLLLLLSLELTRKWKTLALTVWISLLRHNFVIP